MAKLHTTPEERERKETTPNRTVGVYETKGKKGRSKTMMIIAVIALIILAIFLISQLG